MANFPGLEQSIQTQLMSSGHRDFPSARVFLSALNPAASEISPSAMRGSIIAYEHMSRYTERSDRFVKIHGRWHPLSSTTTTEDGNVS